MTALSTYPDSFTMHPKLERILGQRAKAFAADQVDWALAEALAFGTLLQEGTPVRIAGQDTPGHVQPAATRCSSTSTTSTSTRRSRTSPPKTRTRS